MGPPGAPRGPMGAPGQGGRERAHAGGLGEPPVVGGAAPLTAAAAARVPRCGDRRWRPLRGPHAQEAQERKAGPSGGPGGAFVGTGEGRGARAGGKRRGRGTHEEKTAHGMGEESGRLERACGRVVQDFPETAPSPALEPISCHLSLENRCPNFSTTPLQRSLCTGGWL